METIGGDAFEMTDQKGAELLHFRQPLPAQGLDPADEKVTDTLRRLVGPEAIELLAEHIGFEEAAICGEQRAECGALGSANGLPAAEQQPPFPAAVFAHAGTSAEELLPAHIVEGGAGVLQHV